MASLTEETVVLQGVFEVGVELGELQNVNSWNNVGVVAWDSLSGSWSTLSQTAVVYDVSQALEGHMSTAISLDGSFVLTTSLNGRQDVGVTLNGAAGDGTVTMEDQSFSAYPGETRNVTIKVVDANGNAVNLTGMTLSWTLVNQGETVLTKTPVSDSNGNITFTIANTDTQSLKPGNYRHYCDVTDASGNDGVVAAGAFTVKHR